MSFWGSLWPGVPATANVIKSNDVYTSDTTPLSVIGGAATAVTPVVNGNNWPPLPGTANVIKSQNVFLNNNKTLSVIGGRSVSPQLNSIASQGVYATATTPLSVIGGGGQPVGPSAAPTIPVLFAASDVSIAVAFNTDGITGTPTPTYSGLYGTTTNPTSTIDAIFGGQTFYRLHVSSLTLGTTLYFKSVASNPSGVSTSAVSLGFSTFAIGPNIPPSIPAFISTNSTTMIVSFDVAGISGQPPPTYSTLYGTTTSPTTPANAVFSSGTIYQTALSGLTSGTNYYFKSLAGNPGGVSTSAVSAAYSTIGPGQLPPSAAPTAPILVEASTNTIKVSYDVAGITGTAPITFLAEQGTQRVNGILSTGTIYESSFDGLTAARIYNIKSIASNPYGAEESVPVAFSTLGGVAPNIAPSIPALVPESVSTTTLSVTFDVAGITGTPPPTYSTLYGTTTSPTTPANAVLSTGTIYRTNLTGLSSATNYYFESVASNPFGVSTSAVSAAYSTLTLPPAAPNKAPTNPAFVTGSASTNALSVTFDVAGITGNPPPTYSTLYGTTTSPTTPANAVLSTGTIYRTDLTGLTANTNYYFESVAGNASGVLTSGLSAAFSTLAPPPVGPNVAPTIPAFVPGSANLNVLSVTFDVAGITGEPPPTYSTLYGTTTSPTTPANAVLSTGTIYRTDLTGLSQGTNYYFESVAGNASGVSTSAVSAAFSTLLPTGPNIAPTIPSFVSADGFSMKVRFDVAGITGAPPPTYSTLWGTTASPTNPYDAVLSTGTIYETNLPGLGAESIYYFASQASNSSGVSTSAVSAAYSTLARPPTGNPTAPEIFFGGGPTATSMGLKTSLSGVGGQPAPSSIMYYGTTNPPTSIQYLSSNFENNPDVWGSTITGLTPLTGYYIVAVAYNSGGSTISGVANISTTA